MVHVNSFEEQMCEYEIKLANRAILDCHGNKPRDARSLRISRPICIAFYAAARMMAAEQMNSTSPESVMPRRNSSGGIRIPAPRSGRFLTSGSSSRSR
jgi:hypothetical protein